MTGVIHSLKHLHRREQGFLGLIALTGLLIALHLASVLEPVGAPGGGSRAVDRDALERRIRSGELRDREAEWFRPATGLDAAGGLDRGSAP